MFILITAHFKPGTEGDTRENLDLFADKAQVLLIMLITRTATPTCDPALINTIGHTCNLPARTHVTISAIYYIKNLLWGKRQICSAKQTEEEERAEIKSNNSAPSAENNKEVDITNHTDGQAH